MLDLERRTPGRALLVQICFLTRHRSVYNLSDEEASQKAQAWLSLFVALRKTRGLAPENLQKQAHAGANDVKNNG
jgi:hypothetical protein